MDLSYMSVISLYNSTYDIGGIRIRMSMRKVMKKIFGGTWKMILKVFLTKKILGELLVEYLGNISRKTWRGSLWKYLDSISGKNLRGITGEIFVGYLEEDFGENIDHYILFVDISSQTNILKWNLKFILNLEQVWENFRIWIFGMLQLSQHLRPSQTRESLIIPLNWW
jgi:hypothetical protein